MNNLSASIKKFMGNKNTVTILGLVLCVVILIIGYNRTINSKVQLVTVPVAAQAIQPKTQITAEMIEEVSLPAKFLGKGAYYRNRSQIVGKYSNYNTMIAKGSLFYVELLTEEKYMPDSYAYDIQEGYTLINYPVNMSTTYANSMMPNTYINIYFKAVLPDEENEEADEDKIMFGKFLSNIEILAVKDSQGRHVFENTEEARTPAYILYAIPEDYHLLLRKALYLQNKYSVEILIIPNTIKPKIDETIDVTLTSEQIKEFIELRTQAVTLLPLEEETPEDQNNQEQPNPEE